MINVFGMWWGDAYRTFSGFLNAISLGCGRLARLSRPCWRERRAGGFYFPMQHTDWVLVEVALLLNGLTQISLTKSGFN
jgi:hypothetical protein